MSASAVNPVPQDSDEARKLVARAHRLEDASDRAFKRWITGEVRTARGAGRLRAQADEAWCDVRFLIEHGDEVEARELGLD